MELASLWLSGNGCLDTWEMLEWMLFDVPPRKTGCILRKLPGEGRDRAVSAWTATWRKQQWASSLLPQPPGMLWSSFPWIAGPCLTPRWSSSWKQGWDTCSLSQGYFVPHPMDLPPPVYSPLIFDISARPIKGARQISLASCATQSCCLGEKGERRINL